MRSRFMTRVGIELLLLAAVLAVSACGCSRPATSGGDTAKQSQLASGTTDASASVSATGSAGKAGQDEPTSGTASEPTPKPLSDADAKAIDAELSAIQRELDSMSLPGDSDFGGIESGLE
jgi:hypothetical protein